MCKKRAKAFISISLFCYFEEVKRKSAFDLNYSFLNFKRDLKIPRQLVSLAAEKED